MTEAHAAAEHRPVHRSGHPFKDPGAGPEDGQSEKLVYCLLASDMVLTSDNITNAF